MSGLLRKLICGLVAFAALAVPAVAEGRISSGFGFRVDPVRGGIRHHAGLDIAVPSNSPTFATGDGWVVYAGWRGGYGYMVAIMHPSGYETRFAHLSQVLVQPGQPVRRGTVIGLTGSTGRSTGPHLHYEVRFNGQPLNPRLFL